MAGSVGGRWNEKEIFDNRSGEEDQGRSLPGSDGFAEIRSKTVPMTWVGKILGPFILWASNASCNTCTCCTCCIRVNRVTREKVVPVEVL